ncbi:uncharacterized protein LOC141830973 [Curcuma longa]|uniref:uncharacterized protein LOC141830973 n=1 Tax=Curcuma longa TaxID=136217 RepID=UPI003D9F5AEB
MMMSIGRRRIYELSLRLSPAASSSFVRNPFLGMVDSSTNDDSTQPLCFHSPLVGNVRGITCGILETSTFKIQQREHGVAFSSTAKAFLSSVANKDDVQNTETVEELYQKILKSLEARTMSPNAWLWSLISKCSTRDDIKLLFDALHKLRIFRLSNLRIHSNFNCHLCMKVSEACARANALDYGLKTLWKHNIYGLSPSIGSAHYLLSYAKEHNDDQLMVKIMRILERNSLPLQAGTADKVFSICYNTNNWDLISKYATKFLSARVKLRPSTFDIWMEFAAKLGDAQSIWKIEKLRAKSWKEPTVLSGLSCAKGYLLEHNPETAAATIHLLCQTLPETKKPQVADELHKLVSQWPLDIIKIQKKENKQALAESLNRDIPAMLNSLISLGLDVPVDVNKLNPLEA